MCAYMYVCVYIYIYIYNSSIKAGQLIITIITNRSVKLITTNKYLLSRTYFARAESRSLQQPG